METNYLLLNLLQENVSKLEIELEASVTPSEKVRLYGRLRTARRALGRAKGRHTSAEWEAIVAETGGICVRCGHQHDYPKEWPVKGHTIPLCAGGSDAIENLMPLCRSCRSARNDEMIDWLAAWRETHPRKKAKVKT